MNYVRINNFFRYHNYRYRRRPIYRERLNAFNYYDDCDFKQRYRLSKATVQRIIELIEDDLISVYPRATDLSPSLQVLITLRYFATGCFQKVVGDLHGVSVATANRIVNRVSRAICGLKNLFIQFPSQDNFQRYKRDFFAIARFPDVVGAIDCTHIKIQKPNVDNPRLFINRKRVYSVNVQATCDADGKITNIVARWPGSTHDSRILENSQLYLKLRAMRNSYLLGDSGYACDYFLMTPLRNPQTAQERRYNLSHARTRNVIERLFGVLKRRFPILQETMRNKLENVYPIIIAIAVLHNIALNNDGEPEFNPNNIQQQQQPAVLPPTAQGETIRS